jgi:hypothetical protein
MIPEVLKSVLAVIWGPAVRRAAAEAVLAIAAAALAAITTYFNGSTSLDPVTVLVARVAIAWAERVFFQAKSALAVPTP